jgi:ribonucleotide reductase beta subunit family protein with ferritin-like domain
MFASTQQKAAKYINHGFVALTKGGKKMGQVEVEWTDYYTEFKIFGLGDSAKLYDDYILNLHDENSCEGPISDIKLDPLF